MPRLSKRSQKFLEQYSKDLEQLRTATILAEEAVRSVLGDSRFDFYLVTSRAKSEISLRRKLRDRQYSNPGEQLTDSIGVRVITYYRNDVDRVVSLLRAQFEVDEPNSADKRLRLELRSFGYRSVHLIVKLKRPLSKLAQYRSLFGKSFEIQVRSILEHAWAEIEHEVVYKAGVTYPSETLRRFAAIAGTLEVLEGAFAELASERDKLIDSYHNIYLDSSEDAKEFDVARLLGFLEAVRPSGLSWRQAALSGKPFPARIEGSCVTALKLCGLENATKLRACIEARRFKSAAKTFASGSGLAPDQISHLAIVAIALAITDRDLLKNDFREISVNTAIDRLLAQRQGTRVSSTEHTSSR